MGQGFQETNLHWAAEAIKPDHIREKKETRDLIEKFKIITGKEDVEPESLFTIADSIHNLRRHKLR